MSTPERSLPIDLDLYEQLIEGWPDAVLVFDGTDQRYLCVNSAAERLVGRRRDEILGLLPADLSHPDDAREIAAIVERLGVEGTLRRPWRALRKDGTIVETEMTLVRRRVGGHLLAQGQFRVLDGAKNPPDDAGRGLALLERSNLAIVMLDRAGVIADWNTAAEHQYGWTAPDVVGRRVDELLTRSDATGAAALGQILTSQEWVGRLTLRHKDGTPIQAMVTSSAIRDEAGQVAGFVAVSVPVGVAARHPTARMRRARVACASCGQEVAGTMRRKYCSEKCRQWAYYHRHRDVQRARGREIQARRRASQSPGPAASLTVEASAPAEPVGATIA